MVREGVLLECLIYPDVESILVINLFPQYFGTLSDVGLTMIHCTQSGGEKMVLEAQDIAELARRTS